MFSESLANGAVESVVMADNGSDTNIMPPSVFQHVEKAGVELRVIHLYFQHSFTIFDNLSKVICGKKVLLDTHLSIIHGTKRFLRDIEWHVGNCET